MPSIIETIHEMNGAMRDMPDDKKIQAAQTMLALMKNVFGHLEILKEASERYRDELFPVIEKQLEAAEKRTEKGIDQILTACEKMGQEPVLADGDAKKTLQRYTGAIFQASNFQDLSAQHLNEVKLRLDDVGRAMDLFIDIMTADPAQIALKIEKYKRPGRSDAHLLNGPAVHDV